MSDAQQRAAEVIRMAVVSDAAARELARLGLLVDDDTARLVNLGRAVERQGRIPGRLSDGSMGSGWNMCLDAIYREAGKL